LRYKRLTASGQENQTGYDFEARVHVFGLPSSPISTACFAKPPNGLELSGAASLHRTSNGALAASAPAS